METYHWSPPFLLEYLGFLWERTERESESGWLWSAVKERPSVPHLPCGFTCCLGADTPLWAGGGSPIVQMEKLREVMPFAPVCPAAKWWTWGLNPQTSGCNPSASLWGTLSGPSCHPVLGQCQPEPWVGLPLPSGAQPTEHDEPDVRVGGAQRVLGCAAVHGAVELGGNPLQHQLPPVELGAAIQEAAPDPCPCEQGLWEDLILLARAGESLVTGGAILPEQRGLRATAWPGLGTHANRAG